MDIKERVYYPAVVESSDDGMSMYFPDIPGVVSMGCDIEMVVENGKLALVERLLDIEAEKGELPTPSELENIELYNAKDKIIYLDIFLTPYRLQKNSKSVTANTTLPVWLKEAGKKADLNFSLLLQKSLIDHLGIHQLSDQKYSTVQLISQKQKKIPDMFRKKQEAFKFDNKVHGLKVDNEENITKSAIASLRHAFRSYFETYHLASSYLRMDNFSVKANEMLTRSLLYQEKYSEIIFHFHHFIELATKDELRNINPLYALKIDTDNLKIINDLRQGSTIEDTRYTVEYMTAIKRLRSLINTSESTPLAEIYNQSEVYEKSLTVLNELRNKAWHRGVYFLHYDELDQFISQRILPLVIDIINNSIYKNSAGWKYNKPKTLKFDPIEEIINEGRKKELDYSRLGFYKAVGLACFSYNQHFIRNVDSSKVFSEKIADELISNHVEGANECRNCFVCQKKSLVLFREDEFDDTDELASKKWWRIWKAQCQECGLLLYDDVDNPSSFEIKENDFWKGEIFEEENGK